MGTAAGSFPDPPFSPVQSANEALTPGLEASLLTELPVHQPTVTDPVRAIGARIVAVDPSVDGVISREQLPQVVFVYAESHALFVQRPPDLEACTDGVQLSFLNKSVDARLLFEYNGTAMSAPAPASLVAPVPFNESELDAVTGYHNMTITILGNMTFTYDRTVHHYRYLPCSEGGSAGSCVPTCELYSIDTATQAFVRQFSASKNYSVENGEPAFFLVKPALREQWYQNNRFDSLVLSRRKFYKVGVLIDGQPLNETRTHEFEVHNGSLGALEIRSKALVQNSSIIVQGNYSDALPRGLLEENIAYAYLINNTYEGTGLHALTLEVTDRFGRTFGFTEHIASRFLSVNGNATVEGITSNNRSLVRRSLEAHDGKPLTLAGASVVLGFFLMLLWLRIRR